MTQPEIDKAMVETHRCNESEAAELRILTGAVVARTGPDWRGGPFFVEAAEAHKIAAGLAGRYPGLLYSVFILAADYYAPPPEAPSPSPPPPPDVESEVGA